MPGSHWPPPPPAAAPEKILTGPRPRGSELWSATRIFAEVLEGFRGLHFVGPCVTVFGSARFTEATPEYRLAREVGAELGRAGFTVMTGGGPGIMEAANRGARDVGGRSIGCNIRLPKEQQPNPYLDRWFEFDHFFVRKLMLVKYSYAFIVMPGGFGTLDETFETLTLIQTRKIKDFPLVFMGTSFWGPLIQFLRGTPIARGTLDEAELSLFQLTDSPQEAVAGIRERAMAQFGLSYGPRAKPRWYLGEIGALRNWRGGGAGVR
ncbi:MAG TPA: TIGR00730 family Rossman fold protein [Myxococcales bacterium]|nr:TIGR00730 family Rossman fold protein [Myxococcales bacterium]